MTQLLAFGNDATIALPPNSSLGDVHFRQQQYAARLTSYHLITLSPIPTAPSVMQLAPNFWVYPRGRNMATYLPLAIRTGQHIARQHPIDVVSAQDPFLTGLAAYLTARRFGLPLSLQFAADMLDNPYWLRQRPLNPLLNQLAHWLIRRAATFRVISTSQQRKLAQLGIATERIWQIPFPTERDRFAQPRDAQLRQQLCPPPFTQLVLFAGRLAPQKNVPLLLRAFAQVHAALPHVRLVLAGDGSERHAIEQHIRALRLTTAVHLSGTVPYSQMPALFAAADLFVLPSIYEGNARVLTEAAAAGLPVVTTAVSGAADTVINGRTGFIIPIGDASTLAQRISHLLTHEDLRRQMGAAARQHLTTHHQPQKFFDDFQTLWQETAVFGQQPTAKRLLFVTQAVDLDDPVLGFAHGWIAALAQQVDKLHVVTLKAGRQDLPPNVQLHAYGPPNAASNTRQRHAFYQRHFARLVGGGQVDAVLVHMIPKWVALIRPYAQLRRIPILLWYTHSAVTRPLTLAHQLATRIVTASPQSYPLPGDHVTAVGHGIDTDTFRPAATPPRNDPPRLLMPGRLTPIKQPHLLLTALAGWQRPFCAHLVGSPATASDQQYVQQIELTIKNEQLTEKVRLVGALPHEEMPAAYRQANVVVNLSQTHSLDKTVLEAMACGVPVITSNTACAALLRPVAPWLVVPDGDVVALRQALDTALALPPAARAALGQRLRQVVVADHSLSRLAARLVAAASELRT